MRPGPGRPEEGGQHTERCDQRGDAILSPHDAAIVPGKAGITAPISGRVVVELKTAWHDGLMEGVGPSAP